MDNSQPGSSVRGILQARILRWLAFSPPGDLPDLGIKPTSPVSLALQADSLPSEPPPMMTIYWVPKESQLCPVSAQEGDGVHQGQGAGQAEPKPQGLHRWSPDSYFSVL